jgi:hypothetical protein
MSANLRYVPTEFICTAIVLCCLPQIPANLTDAGLLSLVDDRERGGVKYDALVQKWVARSDTEWTARFCNSDCGWCLLGDEKCLSYWTALY